MTRKALFSVFGVLLVGMAAGVCPAETIEVHIKGVDDGMKTTKQQDYKEAVLFAKREAIERAGVRIKAMTTARDMVVNSDYIESKAEAALMPGYTIIDIGYTADGTYQVVLLGKVRPAGDAEFSESLDSRELRYAKSLYEMGKENEARNIIRDILANSKDDAAVAEAMYCEVLWNFSPDPFMTYAKLKSYYPNSKYTARLKALMDGYDRDGNYMLYPNGIIEDKDTKLEWCMGPENMVWRKAKGWAQNLKLAGGGWRLPTMRELQTLYEENGRNKKSRLFNVQATHVWSSEMETCRDVGDSSWKCARVYIFAFSPETGMKGYFNITNTGISTFAVRRSRG
ncbi:MAG: DUF1566 domain-containing protein [Thermodesulfobacteriota bacterium]|nr:DUF1566 domain-containing protein [Thermodesulfobacteriota bacterium]